MKGFIVDASYRIIHGKAYVSLFGRSEEGEAFLVLSYYRPYFFIKKSDLAKAQNLEDFDFEEVSLKNFQGHGVVKILVDIPSDVSSLRKMFEPEGIQCYEGDIQFSRRFLIDHKLQAFIEVVGDYDYQGDMKVYTNPELKAIQPIVVPLKLLAMDIETDSRARTIYSISLVCGDFKKVLIVSEKKLKHAESFVTEKEMLERFFSLLKELDPDLILGWHLIDFDLQVIKKRCQKLEVPFILGRFDTVSKITLKQGYFSRSRVLAEGRQIIDLLSWVKDTTKLDDYKLETAAQHFLQEGKSIVFTNKSDEIEEMYKKNQQKLVLYNLKDSELVLRILEKINLLSLFIRRSALTGLMIDEVKGSIASLDALYLRKIREKKYVAPSVAHSVKEESITGGYVMDSIPGLYENIIVFDFKSLYPSLMRTFNIDPLSFGKKGIKAPNGATFSKDIGVMPEIIEELMEVREEYRKKKDEVGRYAIKILLNSFFGVMASPLCRYYNLELANAITSFAQFFIKKTAEIIREEGYEVIYSDTDSCFVIAGKRNPEDLGRELEEKINKIIKDFIRTEYYLDSCLQLEFEKVYSKFIMPRLRGADKGAKKRYAGLVHGKLEVVGMEAVRGDWTPLAKKFQEELLMRVFTGQKVEEFISHFVKDLKKGKYDTLLVYKKSLRKPLKDYIKTTPPHVQAARKQKGFSGTVVKYVYSAEGVEPYETFKGSYNYDHYIQKQIKPIADSVLVFLGLKFEELLSGQKSLVGY
ncbi:MAG: DNA polymerase II [bacterium]|nr:DNA polymerase II [bacterium]